MSTMSRDHLLKNRKPGLKEPLAMWWVLYREGPDSTGSHKCNGQFLETTQMLKDEEWRQFLQG